MRVLSGLHGPFRLSAGFAWVILVASTLLSVGDAMAQVPPSFTSLGTFSTLIPSHLAAGDIDGDGDVDVFLAKDLVGSSVWLRNDGVGNLTEVSAVLPPLNVEGAAMADFDRDGDLDLVIATGFGNGGFGPNGNSQVLLNDGTGVFTSVWNDNQIVNSRDVAIGDFNGDNWPDFAIATLSSASKVWLNDGTGTGFSELVIPYISATGVAVGELGGTLGDDVVFSNGSVLLSSVGGFAAPVSTNISGFTVDVADIDADNDNDIVAAGNYAPMLVGRNNGNDTFTQTQSLGQTTAARFDADIADINNDGFPDIVVASQSAESAYLNDGTGLFSVYTGTYLGERAIVAADMDGDGDTDIVAGYTNTVQINGQPVVADPLRVTSTADSGTGSLREAILYANSHAGLDRITFALPGPSYTISLSSALPNITDRVVIDGCSQPGSSCTLPIDNFNLLVEIDGGSVAGNGLWLTSTSAGSTIRGLVINNLTDKGIAVLSTDNLIERVYVGTDPSGTLDGGIVSSCVEMRFSGAQRNIVQHSLLSGCNFNGVNFENGAIDNIIRNNRIGTTANGKARLPNGVNGVQSNQADDNIVRDNTIVGGIYVGLVADDWVFEGNYIGTNPDGDDLANGAGVGVRIVGNRNRVGGPGVGNTIKYVYAGIQVDDVASANNLFQENVISNVTGAIFLNSGSNGGVAAPILTRAEMDDLGTLRVTVQAASTGFIEVFATDATGQYAEAFVGTQSAYTTPGVPQVLVIGDGTAAGLGVGDSVVATFTDTNGVTNTSTLSASEVIVAATTSAADKAVLEALYAATNGANWTDNTGWLVGDPSTWFGVTVVNSRVTEIDLSSNNLVGTLPSSLGTLSALEVLDLGANRISGGIPGTLGGIATLRSLDLSENDLTGAIPSALGNASGLTTIRLYSNNLTGSIPSSLGALPLLDRLNLDGNKLTGAIPASFSGAANLTFLSLTGNTLSGTVPSLLGTSLYELYLGSNAFSGAAPALPPMITHLVLSDNAFDAIGDYSGGGFSLLTTLSVEGNQLDFDDLLPNLGIPSGSYSFSPQGVFGEPQNKAAVLGTARVLSAPISQADTYQWYKDGVPIANEDGLTLSLASVSAADAGQYTLQATNASLGLTLSSDDISVSIAGDVELPFGYVFETFADGFERPEGLAVDGNGNILIADAQTGVVRRFDPSGVPVGPDPLISGLSIPVDLAAGADGYVYVAAADGVHRILPAATTTVAGSPWLAGKASEVTFGPSGSLFVSRAEGVVNERIMRVRPADLATASANVYMTFPDTADWDPQGITWDREGNQFIVARGVKKVLRVSPGQTTPIKASSQPVAFSAEAANGAAFGADLKVYVATSSSVLSGTADAAVLTPFVEGLGGDGFNQIAIDGDGRLYIADGATGRVVRVVAPQQQAQDVVPVPFFINAQGLPSVSNGSDFIALQEAFDAWTSVSTSSVAFPASVPTTSIANAGNDGTNVITFVDDTFPMAPGVLAVAAKTLIVSAGGDPDEAEIVDVDVVFNPYYVNNPGVKFGISTTGGDIPIGAVAAHELGHAVGLFHSGIPTATMWFALQPGNEALTLEFDDEARVSQLYPGAGLTAYGTISGTISDGQTYPAKVAGALVTGTHQTSGDQVSAYSDLAGEYTLPRLTPGFWDVDIQPLDGDVYGFDLRPRNISAYHRAITHNTDFIPEFYTTGDSDSDPPSVSTPVEVAAGATAANIDIITNVDLTAPAIAGIFPADGATAIATTESVALTFSEEIDPATLEMALLEGGVTPVSASVVLEPGGVLAILTPTEPLRNSKFYTVTVDAGLTDIRGNTIAAGFSASFTTDGPDAVSPTVAQITPSDGTTGVFITDVVTVRFSEPMDPVSITSTSFSLSSDGVAIDGEVTVPSGLNNTTAVFTPDGNLPEGTTILVTLSTAVLDITGNALAAPFASSFSTVAVQAPTILDVGPADLTADVAVETPVLVDFDEPIAASSVNPLAVVFSPPVSGTYTLLLDNSRLLFQPSANLAYSTTYTVTVGAGLTDLTGNPLVGTEMISFTTSSAPALAPVIISASPPSAGPGADVVITGTGFSPIPASNVVTFGSVAATVRRSSLTSIVAEVPAGADLGDLIVSVNGQSSNPFPFLVVNSLPILGDEVKIGASESGPSDVDVTPDGVKALVTYPSTNKVQEIDLGTTTVAGTVPVGDTPFKVAINPTGTRAYVTNFGDHTVSVLDLTVSPPTVQATIPVGLNPTGIAVAPDGSKVFVAQKTSQSVAVIDANDKSLAYNQTVNQVRLGSESGPEDVEAGPDGTKLYVGGAGGIYVIELDPASPDFESVKHVSESGTEDVEVSPDGTQLFAVTQGGFIQIVDIDPNSASPYAVVNTSESGVEKVEVGPDGTQLFATTTAGEVKVFAITYNTGTADAVTSLKPGLALIETISVGDGASGIAVTPGTGTIVVANSAEIASESVSILEGILTEISVDLSPSEPGPYTLIVDGTDTVLRASNGVEVLRTPVGSINNLRINGTAGDDHLIIDLSNGSPTTGLVISYYGGDQGTGGDQLTVTGASSSDVEHVFYDEHSGQINIDGFGTINYFELEPVTDNMDAVNRVFTLSAGLSQTVVLSADGDGASGNGISFIDSDNGSESISFANPTGTLSIVGDAGADTFQIGPLDTPSSGLTSLTVTGGLAADSFLVRPSSLYPITVNGGSPTVCTGDVLVLELDGITGATLTMTGPGMGTWSFDAPHLPITFTGIGSQPQSKAVVDLSLSTNIIYTVDAGGLVLSLKNTGTDPATCVSVVIPDALIAAFAGGTLVPSDGTLSGSPLTWTIPLMDAGAEETLTVSGLMSSFMPESHTLSLTVGGTPVESEVLATSPGFRFPAKAFVNTAIETSVDITVGGMPYSYDRLIVGLFQGSPGIDTSVWCAQPSRIPGLFEPPGYTGYWRPCGEGLPHPLHANDLHEDDLGTLWLATWGSDGLYRSIDRGITWEAAEPNLNNASDGSTGWVNVYAITQDSDGILFISANNGQVFRSLNHGGAWQQVASLPHASADTPWSLTGHATRPGTVFAGTFGRGVYVSADYGFSWDPVGSDALNQVLIDADAGHIFDLAFSPDDPDVLFAGTASGTFRGTPFAVTPSWTALGPTVTLDNGSIVIPEVRTLAFVDDAGGDDDLLAGTWGFGVFASDEPLTTTGLQPLALRQEFISTLAPLSTGGVFVGTRDGLGLVVDAQATSTSVSSDIELPEEFQLDQNYPNPFNPSTTLRFGLTEPGWARLTIVDVLGRQVATLVDGPLSAGYHQVQFEASGLPSGIYLYVLESAHGRLAKSLILTK